jgi:hypothetical protein
LLNVALANSAEIIGKDLLDSINLVSGANGIGKTTSAIENMATSIGNAVYGVASLINRLKGIYRDTFIGDVFGLFSKVPNLSTFGAAAKARSAGTPAQSPGQRKAIDKANADALKLQKSKNSLQTIDNAATARKIVLTADQQALEELKKKFDVERVGLYAALNNATDQETQLRIKSLIAIKDNDSALAGKIKAELEGAKAADYLSSALYKLSAEYDMERARMAIGKTQVTGITGISPIASSQQSLDAALKLYPDFGNEMDAARTAAARGGIYNTISLNVQGSVTTERDLVAAITQGIYNNQASGIPISYSTAY